jgi:hypothetical protein
MRIFTLDCETFDECFMQKKNDSLFSELIFQMDEELLTLQQVQAEGGSNTNNIPFPTNKNIGRLGKPPSLASDDTSLEAYRLEKGELIQLSPENYDQVELLDNGVTWAFKTRFHIKKNHLVICIARNEIGGK